ncbi:MAG: DUF502 domain-containing protein [Myxococcales bacterium]|nr:DUF502 domain-containing protein [Myxococcales bacterium]
MPAWSAALRRNFLAGLLALLPLFITWKVLSLVFGTIDGVLGPRADALLSLAVGRPMHIPGMGLVATVIVILFIGMMANLMVFKRILVWMEEGIERLPVVRSLYAASRQIVAPFAGEARLPFSKVVMVEYPMAGRWTLGLVAKDRATSDPEDDRVVVFFPSNHLHLGYPVVLSRHAIQEIDMEVEDAVKFFVSCGVVGDDRLLLSGGVPLQLGRRP